MYCKNHKYFVTIICTIFTNLGFTKIMLGSAVLTLTCTKWNLRILAVYVLFHSEVEKFIADNTKEISKEKFLCPLSGKKFRGPEFVRKHIFNKHASKLEEVKQNVG